MRFLLRWICARGVPFAFLLGIGGACSGQKVAITFDDLPLNGLLPPGETKVEIAKNTLAVLKARHVPAAYGFINAKKLEGDADAAEALKLWAAAEPVGNHTYSHLDLNENPAEGFEREIDANENRHSSWSRPKTRTGIGCVIHFFGKAIRRRSGAPCGRI
jgi:peptidoglycan/xylan/chitin deacetylase (PgdA/CDA1 family)